MKIRLARRSDKDSILRFCTNTFAWGDYIDKVFDKWCSEPDGKLLVVENDGANRTDNNNANYHSPKQLQIISYETSELSKIMFSFDVKESAQFFLYSLSL